MKLRWPHWLGIAMLALLLSLAGLFYWVIATRSGTHWALQRAQGALAGKLAIGTSSGTLAGLLELRDVHWRDPESGMDLAANRVRFDMHVAALLRMRLRVALLDVQRMRITLREPTRSPKKGTEPFSLQPPLDILVDRFALHDARVTRDGKALVELDSALLAGNWTDAGIELRQLDVRSPQGEVHFAAQVNRREYYEGKGAGRFRWRVGELEYAGRLDLDARGTHAKLDLLLSAPVTATLKTELEQTQELPWRFTFELPELDPRTNLLPDSSLHKVGVHLQGSGTAAHGNTAGTMVLNDTTLQVERFGFAQEGARLDIDALLRLAGSQGQLQAKGAIQLSGEPVTAKLTIDWRDIVIPADLAGQVLHTRGALDFDGSAQRYRANGKVTLGPPKTPADIQLRVAGGDARIEIEQLDIVQPQGRLAATGVLTLQPQLAWQMQAKATRFDVGAFAAAWSSSLDFSLDSRGVKVDSGIDATLKLEQLTGKLRNRAVAGNADLSLASNTVSGTLDVRSGGSRVRLRGSGSRAANVVAVLVDAQLDDWLPDATGRLDARIDASGKWPDLKVSGSVHARELRRDEQHVGRLDLQFAVTQPLQPAGDAALRLEDAALAGFTFAKVDLEASGSESHHAVRFTAQGKPLSTELALQGALRDGAWQGALQSLILDATDVAHLTLQQPVQISYDEDSVTVSQACFADRDMRLCFEGGLRADRSVHAKYSLRALPLSLVNSVLAPTLPLSIAGTLEGDGDVRRDTEGLLSGNAALRSTRGSIAQRPLDADEQARVLLTWADLAVQAQLAGRDANASLSAKLNDTGSLAGTLAVYGLDSASTGLRGNLAAKLPSIAVIEAFAPQVANLQGKLALQANIAGTLDAPRITGELAASELATELPDIGLKLHDGTLSVQQQGSADAPMHVVGAISSGKGKIEIDGTATTAGTARLAIKGQDFLAADMPGVHVNVTPDLDFERSADRMTLTGDLRLQGADIDLQKLPRGNRAQAASADVVVVDETLEMQKQAQSIPLSATVNVDLGENVKLAGYGLDATVAGKLIVRERAGEPTTGSGEIRVAGTYKAYGQDLTIRQGQLLYAQTPLDNPRLNIVAVRVVDTVTAGLRVSGSAQSPQLSVFSDPAMGQSSALSYLVAGKPLENLGEGEGDALQSAARSLGTAAGGLLAKNLGKRLGVDEIGIKDSAALGGSALTVGQYLSPRLYLSYGVGLFTPGEVLTLRYKLGRGVSLEAENAAQNSRAGVQYRLER